MFRPSSIYIDLGTTNTLVYVQNRGLVLNEPSILALRSKGQKQNVLALGHKAKVMVGRTAGNSSVKRPLKEGVIADFETASRMLHSFMKDVKRNYSWVRPEMIISLPCQVSSHERQAVMDIGFDLGARKVQLLDEPVAAAIGAGLPILSSRGQMIVDIGGGTTEVAIISLGGIVISDAIRVGGDHIDQSIIHLLNQKFHFLIGEQTAEHVKMSLAVAKGSQMDQKAMEVGGLDLISGLPRKLTLSSSMISPVIDSFVSELVQSIKKVFEGCPPEIAADISDNGVVLAGGGSLIHGLPSSLSQQLGTPVKISDGPLLAVARGGAKVLDEQKVFTSVMKSA